MNTTKVFRARPKARRQRRRGQKGRKGLQVIERAWQPAFPIRMPVKLTAANYQHFSASTGPLFTNIGIVEFLGNLPQWNTEFFAIYRYCLVTGIEVEVTFVNEHASITSQLALGVVPYTDVSALTMDELIQTPGSVRKIQTAAGGLSKSTIVYRRATKSAIGVPNLGKGYWFDVTQASSTTPMDSKEPILVLGVSDYAGASAADVTGSLEYKVHYHCVFFDPRPNT